MYRAFNDNVIVKVENNTHLQTTVLEAEVIATTEITKELQGKTIVAERRHYTELSDTGEATQHASGLLLGTKKSYASLDIKHIVAVKE